MANQKAQLQSETRNEIRRTDTIQDIFDKFPGKAQKLAQIMTNSGLSCIGCHASTFETLEQGTLGHGMDEGNLQSLLKEMNRALNEKVKIKEVLVTKEAVKKINALLKKEGKKSWGLKIGVESGGCSGSQYLLGFQEKALQGEKAVESNGIKLFYLENDTEKLSGSEIDYVDGLQGAGFKINNPNVTKSCRCGSSVGF